MTKVKVKGPKPEFDPITLEVTIEDMDTYLALRRAFEVGDLHEVMDDYHSPEYPAALDRLLQEIGAKLV